MNPTRRHVVTAIAAIPVAPLLARGEAVMAPAVAPAGCAPAAPCCSCGVPAGFTVTVSGMSPGLDGCYDGLPGFMTCDGRGYTLDMSLLRQVIQLDSSSPHHVQSRT